MPDNPRDLADPNYLADQLRHYEDSGSDPDAIVAAADLLRSQARRIEELEGGGAGAIAIERRRQVEAEGWTPDHDAQWNDGQLVAAAVAYCEAENPTRTPLASWPWDRRWWKPKDRRSNLVRGGALIAAELDRIDALLEGGAA